MIFTKSHSIPNETSWIKATAFTWSTQKRYGATTVTALAIIFVAWLIAFKPLALRKKSVLLLDQECRMLEHEMRALKEDRSRLTKAPAVTYGTTSALLTSLTHLLESAGITLDSYTTQQRKKGSSCLFKLTVTGTFESFLQFLESLKNEAAKLQLKNITLTRQHAMRLQALIELQSTPLI